jgi:hypothetical protein
MEHSRPQRLWVRIMAFQAVEQGSIPCGVTAGAVEHYHAGFLTPEAACESGTRRPSGVVQWAGPVAVNHVISVRVTAPEPW